MPWQAGERGIRHHRTKGNTSAGAQPISGYFRFEVGTALYDILGVSDRHGDLGSATLLPRKTFVMSRGRRISHTLAGLVVIFCLLEGLVRFCLLGPGTLFAAGPDIGKVPMRGTHVL